MVKTPISDEIPTNSSSEVEDNPDNGVKKQIEDLVNQDGTGELDRINQTAKENNQSLKQQLLEQKKKEKQLEQQIEALSDVQRQNSQFPNKLIPEERQKLQEKANLIYNKLQAGKVVPDADLNELQEHLPPEHLNHFAGLNLDNKQREGKPLSLEEKKLLRGNLDTNEQKLTQQFKEDSNRHILNGGKRIIHITDTEASPDDLENIMRQNLAEIGLKNNKIDQKSDVVVHTGDLLEDFINFKKPETNQFLKSRIIKEGGLEGRVAEEFAESYEFILKSHGLLEYDLVGRVMSEDLQKGLQSVFFGVEPLLMNKKEKEEYRIHFETFKKHMYSAIENDAKNKYTAYKQVFEKFGITPENMILIEGNHDVPRIMREVFGDYMPNQNEISERKGIKFSSPLTGSTGSHLGNDFIDLFGYTDEKEKLELTKQSTKGFKELKNFLKDNNFHYTNNELSQFYQISKQRFSKGLGLGHLARYEYEVVNPQMDLTVTGRVKKTAGNVLKDGVDFYLTHGQLDHMYKGLEEEAVLREILDATKEKGGSVIHGHIHGKTTHKVGNTSFLNQGDGKSNFGVYEVNNVGNKNSIGRIYNRTYNSDLNNFEREYTHVDALTPKKVEKVYQ